MLGRLGGLLGEQSVLGELVVVLITHFLLFCSLFLSDYNLKKIKLSFHIFILCLKIAEGNVCGTISQFTLLGVFASRIGHRRVASSESNRLTSARSGIGLVIVLILAILIHSLLQFLRKN